MLHGRGKNRTIGGTSATLRMLRCQVTNWCRVRKILRAGGEPHRLHAAQQSGYGTNFPMLQICALGQFMQRYGGAMNVEGITLFMARCSIEDNEATVNSRSTFYHVIDHTDLFSRADVWWWFAH